MFIKKNLFSIVFLQKLCFFVARPINYFHRRLPRGHKSLQLEVQHAGSCYGQDIHQQIDHCRHGKGRLFEDKRGVVLDPLFSGGGHFCEFHFGAFNKCSFCGWCYEEDRCHEVKDWVIQQGNVSINLSHRYVLTYIHKESGQSGGVDLWKVNSRVLRFCKHDAREASKAKKLKKYNMTMCSVKKASKKYKFCKKTSQS